MSTDVPTDLQELVDVLEAAQLKLGNKPLDVLPYYPNKPPYPPYVSIAADDPFVTTGQTFKQATARWIIVITADARDASKAQRDLYAILAQVMAAMKRAKYPVTNITNPISADHGQVAAAEIEISTFHHFDL